MIPSEILAAEQIGFPILSMLLLLPLAVVAGIWFVRDDTWAYRLALAGSAVELVLASWAALVFVHHIPDMQLVERGWSVPGLGIGYHLGVDGISVLFLPVTALLTLLVILYAEYSARTDTRHYVMATLALEATMIGAFVSLDLVMFWLFFVLELVPSYFLITRWGTGPQRRRAAQEYIVFMLMGSAAMLLGIVVLAFTARGTTSALSFDLLDLLRVPVPAETQSVIFFLLFVGFAIKAPVFPFHTWLPKVLEQGPVVGMSVFLVGIKLGTYGFLRFVIPLLPEAAKEWAWIVLGLGAAGVVYGAMIALIQTNLRRLLAFGSLSHMGGVMIGLFSLNFSGFQGGLLQMINLGIVGAGLFFVAGFLYSRVGTPDLSAMGGLVHSVPVLTATFLVIALAGIGLPGTNGFNGEHLIMLGAFKAHWFMALATGLGTFLTAAYSLWYFQRAFLGQRPAGAGRDGGTGGSSARAPLSMPDLKLRELIIAVALGGLVFWIGMDTGPFLRTMNGSLSALEVRVNRASPVETGGARAAWAAPAETR